MRITRPLILTISAFLAASASCIAWGEEPYPTRPVRLIVTFAAGGGVDIPARALAHNMEKALGQTIVVENKPGAGGMVGAVEAARAKPDGYTMVLGTVAQVIGKHIQPSSPFDPVKDFVHVSLAYKTQSTITVSSRSSAKSLSELVQWAKARPGALNYYSGGVGTAAHLLGTSFSHMAGISTVHIPVRTINDVLPQLTDDAPHFACFITPTVLALVKSGRMRALAVASRERVPQLPEVPTLFEIYKDENLIQEAWLGIWVPAGTPPYIVNKLFEATTKAARSPAFKEAMEKQGQVVAVSGSPAEFTDYVRAEMKKWGGMVSRVDMKAN